MTETVNQADLEAVRRQIERELEGEKKREALARYKLQFARYEGLDKVINIQDLVEQVKNKEVAQPVPTGIKELDDAFGGFRPGNLISIIGHSGSGKTSYAMQMTQGILDCNPMWLSYEMPAEELVGLFLERGQEVPRIYSPAVNKRDNHEWIKARILESQAKYDSRIVFVDNLNWIVEPGSDNYYQRQEHAVNFLKELAGFCMLPIVLIVHTSKTEDITEIPSTKMISGTKAIEAVSSEIFCVWREAHKDIRKKEIVKSNFSLVKVLKNRRYGHKEPIIEYEYNTTTCRFENCEWRSDFDTFDTAPAVDI